MVLDFPGGRTTAPGSVKRTRRLTVAELSEDEKKLIETYRRATPELRTTMQRLALRILQKENGLK